MLLKRDNGISTDREWFYTFNENKRICFFLDRDRSINTIGLLDNRNGWCPEEWHDTLTLCYIESITIDDGELLNVEALMDLARREDNCQEILDERKKAHERIS